jgi:uncharacterized SAM-binding protein YcdF (DUF218 family)
VPRGLTSGLRRDLVRLITVGALAAVTVTGVAALRIWQQGEQDEQRRADAIVVLGAAQYDGRPSPVFAARLDHAIGLFRAGLAPTLIVTGGKIPGDRTTEAAVARQYALDRGVPASAIIGEDEGRNTLSSLESVAGLMRDHGLRSAVFVSDPTHMLRVLRIARDLDIDAYGSPTRTSPTTADLGRRARATVHELGALAVYFFAGGGPSVEVPGG